MIFVFGQKSEGKIYAAKSFSSRNFDYLGVLLSTILRVEFFRAMGLNVNIWPENGGGYNFKRCIWVLCKIRPKYGRFVKKHGMKHFRHP